MIDWKEALEKADLALAGIADVLNQEIRENGDYRDQIQYIHEDMRPYIRLLVDAVRVKYSARPEVGCIERLRDIRASAVMSKFATSRECEAYRQAVHDCVEALRSPQLRLCGCPGACQGYATLSKGVTCSMHVPESIARPLRQTQAGCRKCGFTEGHNIDCPAKPQLPQYDGGKNVG